MKWKMEAPCADCPFSNSAAGTHLRKTLRPGRMAEIQGALRRDQWFTCHKTNDETGNGTNLYCAGALAWQKARGLSSNFMRVCEGLDYFAAQRDERNEGEANAEPTPPTPTPAKPVRKRVSKRPRKT